MKTRALDLIERVLWTAIQGALAVWIVTEEELFSVEAMKVAGVAAAIAAAKCVLAFNVGSSNTAATLPAGPDTDLGGDEGAIDANLVASIILGIVLAVGVLYVLRLAF